jgi:Raf kinase inhibitor-like YbhB/YbcL family protein
MRTPVSMLAICVLALASAFTTAGLKVSSKSFTNYGMIPSQYSCEGAQDSPPLYIENVPENAVSLALIVHDPDAPVQGGFTHWIMWNISTKGKIPENFKGGVQGLNGAHKNGYIGMCPPSGTHHYHFRVYALDIKLDLAPDADKQKLENAMNGHILAQGDLVGQYKKTK